MQTETSLESQLKDAAQLSEAEWAVLAERVGGAWLLRVDGDGSIKWQRNYPRGGAATFEAAAQTKEGEFIIVGKARPLDYDGKGLTAWVMKTDSTGNPLWQRYFNGPYDYEASDLITYEDGRASVLMRRMLALRPGCRRHADAVIGQHPKHRRTK